MASAPVGDDVYGEDPTVKKLEKYSAELMGKEAGLFGPSGTQTNLVAMLTHCTRGDEYIVGQNAHTFKYEGGGAAVLGGIQPNPLAMSSDGTLHPDDIVAAIKPDDIHFPKTKLVCLENTHAGKPLPDDYAQEISRLCKEYDLSLHLDGARVFNAAVFGSLEPFDVVKDFDSVSFCLSKGLGAPIGSVLVGDEEFIETGRRWRKVLGGGMRQAGVIAAAGLYALKHNIKNLIYDHEKASELYIALSTRFGANNIRLATNMLHLEINQDLYASLAEHLEKSGVKVGRSRWVLHKDVSRTGVEKIKRLISSFKSTL